LRHTLVAALLAASLAAVPALAEDAAHLAEAEGLRVLHAWARATDTGEAFVFAEIENRGATERLLTGVEAQGASAGRVVGFALKDGQGSWTVLPSIPVAAGGDLDLAPEVLALRLDGLALPLVEGGHLDVTFVFDTLRIPAEAEVLSPDARAHSHAGHSH
jgi:hypothetical protein